VALDLISARNSSEMAAAMRADNGWLETEDPIFGLLLANSRDAC
jgi:hypothetical protein